jgi:hypothetical protein
MPRKSKYVREKDALLAKLGKTKLSDVTEEEIMAHLESIQEDEALHSQLHANWKRATTKPKARVPYSPAFEAEQLGNRGEEEQAVPPPPQEAPEIHVHDLGIREANAERRRDQKPQPELKVEKEEGASVLSDTMGQCSDTLLALFLQQRSHFSILQGELMSLRLSLAVLVGMCAATFIVANWGDYVMKLFSS